MSDGEKTANMTGASGAGWSEREKIAYLIALCESEGRLEARISNAPIPAGRSVIACKRMISRMKEKHKKDIIKIKNGQPLDTGTNGETSTLYEPKTLRKRKTKAADSDADAADEEDGSPKKKKATPRKSKSTVAMEEPIKMEETVKEEDGYVSI